MILTGLGNDSWAEHSAAEEPVVAMPVKMLLRRPVGRIGRERDFPVLHAREQEGDVAGLGEVPLGDEDGVVIGYGPEAVVEEPVGVLGEGDAVIQVVVAAGGELVVHLSCSLP